MNRFSLQMLILHQFHLFVLCVQTFCLPGKRMHWGAVERQIQTIFHYSVRKDKD